MTDKNPQESNIFEDVKDEVLGIAKGVRSTLEPSRFLRALPSAQSLARFCPS